MSEIMSNNQQSGKRKKHNTRVDLTPMVDLGFLLITFFVFTTNMSMSKAMKVYLPADVQPPNQSSESGTLTLLPDQNKIFYYRGNFETAQKNGPLLSANFTGPDGIRQVILNLKHNLISANGNDEKLEVVIKPTEDCNLKNTVALLDEMTLNEVHRYAMVDISKEEVGLIRK